MSKKGDRKVMKKIRLLIASIVCALMLMGVGYAAWTQSVHVNATATAGELNVRLVNGQSEGAWKITGSDEIANWAIAGNDGKTLTLKFDRLYPGAKAAISGTLKNNGNLPAKLSGCIVSNVTGYRSSVDNGPDLYNYLQASIYENTGFVALETFFNTIPSYQSYVTISGNESLQVPPIYLKLADDAPSYLQGKNVEFSVEFVFELDI